MRTARLLPLSGIAFVALVVLSTLVGGTTPDPAAPAAEVVSFYGDDGRHRIATVLLGASAPFLVFFACSLASLRASSDAGLRAVWRRVVLAGAGAAGAVIAATVLIHLALIEEADRGAAPAAVQALNVLDGHSVYALMIAFGVMMLGAAGWLFEPERADRWLAWSALVLGVSLYLPFVGFLALVLTAVWIVAASVSLFRAGAVLSSTGDPD